MDVFVGMEIIYNVRHCYAIRLKSEDKFLTLIWAGGDPTVSFPLITQKR